MYPMTCYAGFPMPIKKGPYEVYGMRATVYNVSDDAHVKLIDDRGISKDAKFGRILDDTFVGPTDILDVKGIANGQGNLEMWFPETVKVRNGLSISKSDNMVAGSIAVFIR